MNTVQRSYKIIFNLALLGFTYAHKMVDLKATQKQPTASTMRSAEPDNRLLIIFAKIVFYNVHLSYSFSVLLLEIFFNSL